MSVKYAKDLERGDYIYVENHWGDFEYLRVIFVDQYLVYTSGYIRFSKGTGWEQYFRKKKANELKSGKRNRYRIHNGDGVLYSPEYVERFTEIRQREAKRTELIWKILRSPILLWRKLTNEQLEQILEWLNSLEKKP